MCVSNKDFRDKKNNRIRTNYRILYSSTALFVIKNRISKVYL